MTTTISELMAPRPVCLPASSTASEAAAAMRDRAIGAVLVQEVGRVSGIVTDRDITVRVVAEGRSATRVTIGEICSRDLATLSPTDSSDMAVELMAIWSLRRLPVVDGGSPVGVVSLGDLAIHGEPESVLASISGAPPNV
jgi:CBS domain-containing protein